ncbi:MAG TPA: FAD-dependent oxidoreductase [Thermoanaerobaculia bacterium]|nr:FAD-dependent oxidoreductase [Thermoanaerobaculia bacterium]
MIGERPCVAILGAGPAGLDAALEAAERGWGFTLYEAADRPAGGVRSWGHVALFSPWSIDASPRMRAALGDGLPDDDSCPTGRELAESLFDRVAALPRVEPHLRLGTRVVAVGREGLVKNEEISTPERAGRPFRLLVTGPDGRERIERADAVLDCTGSLAHPNTLGDAGIPAPGEAAAAGRIVRRIPDVAGDPAPWAGRTTLLVGGGHSAQTAARDLARLAETDRPGEERTKVIWAVKNPMPAWRIPDDPLPARERLAAEAEELLRGASPAVEARLGVVVESLESADGRVAANLRRRDGSTERVEADRVLALTGAVGDHALYRQLQVHECYATAAPMKLSAALLSTQKGAGGGAADCMSQTGHGADTLVNPEARFFILGAKSYGRNSAYLMRIGWQQVDDAFGVLAESFGA